MEKDGKVFCDQCGKECIPDGCGTGYGQDSAGHHYCYDCCGEQDRQRLDSMKAGDSVVFYLEEKKSEDGWLYGLVSNWPGTLKIRANRLRKGRHNIAGTQTHCWFTFNGASFHGVNYGGFSQLCYITKLKGTAR